jgi:hypothetical protein
MKPSDHQSQIIKYLSTVESATKKIFMIMLSLAIIIIGKSI